MNSIEPKWDPIMDIFYETIDVLKGSRGNIESVVLEAFDNVLKYVKTQNKDLFALIVHQIFYTIIGVVLKITDDRKIIKTITVASRKIQREIHRIDCSRENIGNDDRSLYGD